MGQLTCENCGSAIKPGDAFCCNCGCAIPEPAVSMAGPISMSLAYGGKGDDVVPKDERPKDPRRAFCPNCGKRTKEGWSFCMGCGHALQIPQGTVPESGHTINLQDIRPEAPTGQAASMAPDPIRVSGSTPYRQSSPTTTRTMRINSSDDGMYGLADDGSFGCDETDSGIPDDVPTAVYNMDMDSDVPTMVYQEETHIPAYTLNRCATGESYVLVPPQSIGRGSTADIHIVGNPYIGRVHANFVMRDGAVHIVDEGSANHTFVNGTQVVPHEPIVLHDGDVFSLAKEEFVFSVIE